MSGSNRAGRWASGSVRGMELRDGRTVEDRRLDRLPEYDEASRNFQVRQRLGEIGSGSLRAARAKPKAWRPSKPGLDQLNLGACVMASNATGLNASPKRHRHIGFEVAREWYFDVQRTDEYPGGEYPGATPIAGGTSLLAGMKFMKALGKIDSYWWCGAGSGTAIDDVVDSLAVLGGVQFGVPWYGSMNDTVDGGRLVVDPSSGLGGYHAIWGLAFRYAPVSGLGSAKREHVIVQQTWGPSWGAKWYGVGGHAFVLVEDIEAHLLPREVYGEAVVPVGA